MIRTGSQYLNSIRDGREVYINGGCVKDVTRHSMMKPLIDIRARIYDMQHAPPSSELLACTPCARGSMREARRDRCIRRASSSCAT